jgi:hypothetical protein
MSVDLYVVKHYLGYQRRDGQHLELGDAKDRIVKGI